LLDTLCESVQISRYQASVELSARAGRSQIERFPPPIFLPGRSDFKFEAQG